jgi:hypothetical protein
MNPFSGNNVCRKAEMDQPQKITMLSFDLGPRPIRLGRKPQKIAVSFLKKRPQWAFFLFYTMVV